MSHTKRNRTTSEVLRSAKPYKRQRRSNILNDFEVSYIATNQNPDIRL